MEIQVVTQHASGYYRHVSVIDGGSCPEQLMNEIDTIVKEIDTMVKETRQIKNKMKTMSDRFRQNFPRK